ncbi:MAG: hypothetical protein ACRC2T_07895 [Thermoguttaceae bacterium]
MDEFFDLFKSMDQAILVQNMHYLSDVISNSFNNESSSKQAIEFFDYLWNLEKTNTANRDAIRNNLMNGMVYRQNKELYPYFKEVLINIITPVDKKKQASVPGLNVYANFENPHSVRSWSSDGYRSLSITFLNTAGEENFENILNETRELAASHEKMEDARNWNQYTYAKVLEAMLLFRQNKFEEGKQVIQDLVNNDKTAQILDSCGLAIAQELFSSDDKDLIDFAIKFLEKSLKEHNGGFVETMLTKRLVALYLKSNTPEKGRDRAVKILDDSFHFLKMCGNNDYIQVNNNHYGSWELCNSAGAMITCLSDAGFAGDALRIYRNRCMNQPWFTARENGQRQYEIRELKQKIDALNAKITVEDIVNAPEMFITLPVADTANAADTTKVAADNGQGKTAESQETQNVVMSNIDLMTYCIPFTGPLEDLAGLKQMFASLVSEEAKTSAAVMPKIDPAKRALVSDLIGSKLLSAFNVLAEQQPEKFEIIKRAIQEQKEKYPEEPTFKIANAFVAIAENDTPALRDAIAECADFVSKAEKNKFFGESVNIGLWMLARHWFMTNESTPEDATFKQCEKLTQYSSNYITLNKADNDSDVVPDQSDSAMIFAWDVLACAPPAFANELYSNIVDSTLKNTLLDKSNKLVSYFEGRYYPIIQHFESLIAAGSGKRVLSVFEKVFAYRSWPQSVDGVMDYQKSVNLLFVLERSLDAMKKNGDDPSQVFECLLQTFWNPEQLEKGPFIADYADLGGRNGYFKSPALDVIDWGIAAEGKEALESAFIDEDPSFKKISQIQDESIAMRWKTVELYAMLRTRNKVQAEKRLEYFMTKIKENEDGQAAKFALIAVVPALDAERETSKPLMVGEVDLLPLLDAALPLYTKGDYRRFAYYAIRQNFAGLCERGEIATAVRWAELHRKIVNSDGRLDHRRFMIDEQLEKEAFKAVEDNRLADAVAVLRYFANEPKDSFRYRDLTDLISAIQTKITPQNQTQDKISAEELFGDLDIEAIQKKPQKVKNPEFDTPQIARDFNLPVLPNGTTVYQNDFEKEVGSAWSHDFRDIDPMQKRTYLGEFYNENVTFTLNDLPQHQFIRVKFDLIIIGGIDGLVGYNSGFGADIWRLDIENEKNRRLIGTTFSNFRKDDYNQKQSYPDDYPLDFGFEPSWFERLKSGNLWDDALETGFYYGREGAVVENKYGYEKDAVYAIDMMIPHDKTELVLKFSTQFQDGPYELGGLNMSNCESWAVDNFRVELLDEPLNMSEEEMQSCFYALVGGDGNKSAAARWHLTAAGDKAVDFFAAKYNNDKEFRDYFSARNFLGFRVRRVLQIIDTPKSQELLKQVQTN